MQSTTNIMSRNSLSISDNDSMTADEKDTFIQTTPFITKKKVQTSLLRRHVFLLTLNVTILLCSVCILAMTTLLYKTRGCQELKSERNGLWKQTSHYSPILDEFEWPPVEVYTDGSFFNSKNDSIYRQLPSPAVDKAWERISTAGQVFLTTEQVMKLGKDPAMTVRDNDHPDRHIGLINGFHQIHCLNVIRQNLHREYYFPQGIRSPYHWIHLYHCLNIVLQELQCGVSTDIITYNYVELMDGPVFDFSINRKCRNFDALLEWQENNLQPIEHYRFYREGWERQILAPEQLKRIKEHVGEWEWRKDDPAALGGIEAWY